MPTNNSSNAPLRVLHCVDTYLNISENWIYPQLAQVSGVSSRVLCSGVANIVHFPLEPGALYVDPPPWENSFGIPRFCNAVARRFNLGDALLWQKIGRWNPRLLHAHFGTRGWSSLRLKKYLNCPLVCSFYGYDAWLLPKREAIWRDRYRDLFAEGDLFLVEGPAMRDRLITLECPSEKIAIQRIGANLRCIPYVARNFTGPLRIVMLGRFVEKKGMLDGLKACAIAAARGIDLKVTVVGDASEGDPAGQKIKRDLKEIAITPELAARVSFTGFTTLERTREVLGENTVFLCPSRHAANGDAEGGSPVALTEAMASGLLCIGTNHCDIPELIVDGKTGYLSPEGDPSALADNLCRLACESEQLANIAQAGRHHVEQYFSLERQINDLALKYGAFCPL